MSFQTAVRRFARGAAGALAVTLALTASASAAAPQPVVVGAQLKDALTGATFVPRGVNWPSFEYLCSYLNQGYSRPADPATAATTAAAMVRWHINTVRIPLNQDCWLGDDALPASGTAAGYRAAVASFVATLHAAGLVTILDLHWSGPENVVADGQRAIGDARSDDFWTSVASAFAGDRSTMFDAFNEPYSRYNVFELTWPCWRSGALACGDGAPRVNDTQAFDNTRFTPVGMNALVAAIRAAGATQPILLGGLDYANDLRGLLAWRPADTQLVASFHNYKGQRCQNAACWDAEIAPVAAVLPVVTGEFGESDCADNHNTAFMNWADAHGVGYLAWAWWVLDSTPAEKACSALALISDEAGTPRAPNGTALRAHLDALANQPGAAPPAAQPVATGPVVVQPTPQTEVPQPTLVLKAGKRFVMIGGQSVSSSRGARVAARIDVVPNTRVDVTLRLRLGHGITRAQHVGSLSRLFVRGGRVTLRVPLNAKGRALLGRRRTLALTVRVVARAPAAKTFATTRTTTLKLVRR